MSDFIQGSAELTAALAQCRTAEEIRTVTKALLERQGTIRIEPGGLGSHLLRRPEMDTTAEPNQTLVLETGSQFQRAVHLGDRVVLITAGSVSGLDILERHLKEGAERI